MKNNHSNTEPDISPDKDRIEPARLLNSGGQSSIILVCEHASNHIPDHFNTLGLTPELQNSHIAWDPGALAVAEHVSAILDAPLIAAAHSRLIYDCNRPPEAPDAMPVKSEIHDIPGNINLSEADKADRIRLYYAPFETLVAETITSRKAKTETPVLVTVHSFTPIYQGQQRKTNIGILHDSDTRLADSLLKLAAKHSPLLFRRNDPYGPADGVTHTLKAHGVENRLRNVMIEIRNDLITTPDQQRAIAAMLARLLQEALTVLAQAPSRGTPIGTDVDDEGPECHV